MQQRRQQQQGRLARTVAAVRADYSYFIGGRVTLTCVNCRFADLCQLQGRQPVQTERRGTWGGTCYVVRLDSYVVSDPSLACDNATCAEH
jgi:hypothetical protein